MKEMDRIKYIDFFKAIAMILVIIGHVNFANEPIKAWIYSFHMPAFFFCTGLVFKVSEKISIKEKILNKFHRLILPYMLWALLFASFTIPNFLKILYGSNWSILHAGSLTSLWFLPVMFMALLFFYLSVRVKLAVRIINRIILMFVFFAIACLLPQLKVGYPWGINVAFMAFVFMLLGSISSEQVYILYKYFHLHPKMGLIISCLMFIILSIGTLTYHLNIPSGGYVVMKTAHYGNCGLFVLTAVFGIYMLLFLSLLIELLSERGLKWMSFIGQNTLCIFVIHKPIISCFRFFFHICPMVNLLELLFTTLGTLIISCTLCIIINKYVPVLVGKSV